MADRVGQQLGNYQLVALLGQGGFAEVYLGQHVHSGAKVAIKLLNKPIMEDEVGTFQKEAHILASLRHRNIVRVLEFGVEASTNNPYLVIPYLVMDYAPKGTLRKRHPGGTRLPLSTVVEYVRQIAAALQYAHDQGFIHLDVKPENILLGENDELLLSDFGIARGSASEHAAYHAAGTPDYMAPEQIEGNPGPASDQYALAIMVYEWLCGQLPFKGSDVSVRRQRMRTLIPSLSDQLPISPDVEQAVLKALARMPSQRFDSVHKFAAALEQASTISPLPEQSELTTPGGIARRVVLLGTGSVVGLVLLGTTIWGEIKRASLPPQGKRYLTYRGHIGDVEGVAWSPDGKRIASGGGDGTVQVWNAADGKHVFTYRGHVDSTYGVYAVAWSPDNKHIASSDDKNTQVWDAADGGNALTYSGNGGAVAWSPDGKRIAAIGGSGIVMWDAPAGGNVFTYRGNGGVIAWSPDGKRIASGGYYRIVQVWDAANGKNVFTYYGHANIVLAVAWSPDGQRIASADFDRTVQVWDAANGENVLIYRGHANSVKSVAWSPDGQRIASGGFDKTAQVWDAADGSNVFTYRGHANNVTAVSWSPDGQRIASASFDATVQVWQAV
ncbi:MAG TPA: serine/threonine-protein kinase [Ktedonobacteraceae bacterium]|nr:serine/threonine-protein kinase [Ktedonobacteraceae bacterium]